VKSSEATRERIMQAATVEFAAYGIAGARVDRIARNAAGNKNLIYMYFGSKEQLFTTVLARHLTNVYDSIAFTPENLPDYAARLFDFVVDHPELIRLLAWFGLEQRDEWPVEPRANLDTKLKGIAKAQRDGIVAKDFTPAFLLTTVIALCSAWTVSNPLNQFIDPDALKHRATLRKATAKAVERLTR